MTALKRFIADGLPGAFSFNDYVTASRQHATEGGSSGPNISEDFIRYTKLNDSRLRRLIKQSSLDPRLEAAIAHIQTPTLLICITETWCGDGVQILPTLNLISERNSNIAFHIVWRDQEPNLIDAFLTNGGKSIPKVILASDSGEEYFTWGPRPQPLQTMVMDWKAAPEPKPPYSEFSADIQRWYLKDKGSTFQQELLDLLATSTP